MKTLASSLNETKVSNLWGNFQRHRRRVSFLERTKATPDNKTKKDGVTLRDATHGSVQGDGSLTQNWGRKKKKQQPGREKSQYILNGKVRSGVRSTKRVGQNGGKKGTKWGQPSLRGKNRATTITRGCNAGFSENGRLRCCHHWKMGKPALRKEGG